MKNLEFALITIVVLLTFTALFAYGTGDTQTVTLNVNDKPVTVELTTNSFKNRSNPRLGYQAGTLCKQSVIENWQSFKFRGFEWDSESSTCRVNLDEIDRAFLNSYFKE